MPLKILVNMLTCSRIVLSIILVNYILNNRTDILLITALYLMIWISDYLDGRLARRLSVSSTLGAYLDVLADLFFMLSTGIALIMINNYPVWMLAVVIAKFLEFWYTSSLIRKYKSSGKEVFLSDRLGRKIAATFYVLPFVAVALFYCFQAEASLFVMNAICILITLGALISSVHRVRTCMKYRSTLYSTNGSVYNATH